MASISSLQSYYASNTVKNLSGFCGLPTPTVKSLKKNKRSLTIVATAGEVSPDSTTYLIDGAAAVALPGTAFPILFSRNDLQLYLHCQFTLFFLKLWVSNYYACHCCPECDGADFVGKSGVTLRANAARKDLGSDCRCWLQWPWQAQPN